MGTLDLDQIKKVVKCDTAIYPEWKEQVTVLLSGLSLGQYLIVTMVQLAQLPLRQIR
jgi:hypothetical protein